MPGVAKSAEAPQPASIYDISTDGATVRVRFESAAVVRVIPSGAPGFVSNIGPGLFLLSWPADRRRSVVHVVDVDAGVAYASVTPDTGSPRHAKGTIARVDA